MRFEELNGKSIDEAFAEFDLANPVVYNEIKTQAFLAISKGRKKFSIKAIVNWIRWNMFLGTEDKNTKYRINDAYISRYARKFIQDFPQYEDRIELRQLRSKLEKV